MQTSVLIIICIVFEYSYCLILGKLGHLTEWSSAWNELSAENKLHYKEMASQEKKGIVGDPKRAKKILLKSMGQLVRNIYYIFVGEISGFLIKRIFIIA